MRKIVQALTAFLVAMGAFSPIPLSATSGTLYDFCFKAGDYYDGGRGYHVIECHYTLGGGIGVDTYYILHGTEFKIYQV
jgi:hypothetical protein